MRALTAPLLVALLAAGACGRKIHRANPSATIEDGGGLQSRIQVARGAGASQVIDGLYAPENPDWCWARRKFSVALAPPGPGSGAPVLELNYAVPDTVFGEMKGATVSASIAGRKLAPCTLQQPGQGVCRFPLAAESKPGEPVIAEFEIDRSVPPKPGDNRELALIVSEVGLTRQ